jgi:hypothetical protein
MSLIENCREFFYNSFISHITEKFKVFNPGFGMSFHQFTNKKNTEDEETENVKEITKDCLTCRFVAFWTMTGVGTYFYIQRFRHYPKYNKSLAILGTISIFLGFVKLFKVDTSTTS